MEKEEEMKYYVSLLFEALGELSELSNRIHELEKKIEELSSNHRNSTEISLSNNVTNVPLSKLSLEPELSDTVKSDIEKAVDVILQLGKQIPYLNK